MHDMCKPQANKTRLAVTLWYYDGVEATRAAAAGLADVLPANLTLLQG